MINFLIWAAGAVVWVFNYQLYPETTSLILAILFIVVAAIYFVGWMGKE